MNQVDKELIVKRYRQRLAESGNDIQTLASGNRERQQIRFKILSEVGDLNDHSVLDLGCGFGDFYQHIKERGIRVEYTGYDICPDFVSICKTRFRDARFEVKDIQTDRINQNFDYIISSQTFNNKLVHEDNKAVMTDIIHKAYELANIGVAIDMLSTYVDFEEEHLYYYNPEEIFRFCKSVSKRVSLRNDYPLFEFTIYLYQDFQGWRSQAV